MGRIIVIDGTSNAGKTTLCENLEKKAKNVVIVPGCTEFCKKYPEKFGPIPAIPTTPEEEMKNQAFFFDVEKERLREASRLSKGSRTTVVMDRSVNEILTVAFAFEKIKGWTGIYKNAANLYRSFLSEMIQEGIRRPDKYIWLQASPEEVLRRNVQREKDRGKKLSERDWVDLGIIRWQIRYFQLLSKENKSKFEVLDTNNLSIEQVYKQACKTFDIEEKGKWFQR